MTEKEESCSVGNRNSIHEKRTEWIDEAFLSRQLDGCAALLTDGAGGEVPPENVLLSCLRDCFLLGAQTDDLRAVHSAVSTRIREAFAPRTPSETAEELILFPAVLLSAEGFQLGHQGSLHAHAVGAIAASICKLPYVSELDGRARSPRLTLREELYHGASGLLWKVLDRESIAFFTASPAPGQARAFLQAKLGAAAPEDRSTLCSLCTGACVLSAFHQEGKNRQQQDRS